MEIKEFQIPVPWGYIAVKSYGKEEDPVVLTLHGTHDNAGVFDALIPLLPTSFYYISIDLPGHGKSTAFPPYVFITDINHIFAVKLVTDYLNFKKYICLGHSRGGQYFVFFAQLYPHLIEKIIVIDSLYLTVDEADTYGETLVSDMSYLIKINSNVVKQNIPEYTYEEAITKLLESRIYGKLNRKSAEILINRMIIPVGKGKYRFSVDPRIRVIRKLDTDRKFIVEFIKKKPVTCPCLFIIASSSRSFFKHQNVIYETMNKHNNGQCTIEIVQGDHEVHLNKPEVVAPVITKFLSSVDSKL